MAPAAHLINLKVLDSNGLGTAADVTEAIDFAIAFRKQLGIRVLNLSLGPRRRRATRTIRCAWPSSAPSRPASSS